MVINKIMNINISYFIPYGINYDIIVYAATLVEQSDQQKQTFYFYLNIFQERNCRFNESYFINNKNFSAELNVCDYV